MDNVCLYQLTFREYFGNSRITHLFISNEEAEKKRDLLLREELRKIFIDMMPEEDSSGNLVIRLWPWAAEKDARFDAYNLDSINKYVNNEEEATWKIKALMVEGVTMADISARLEDARLKREREIEQEQ